MFYGREEELSILENKYAAPRKQFGAIYGRRRIGKTEIVARFIDGREGIYFQAVRDTNHGNRRAFSYLLNRLTGFPDDYAYPSWEAALDAVKKHFDGRRYYLVIDEYPEIASQFPGFSSIIQNFYDHSGDNLFLLLVGSDIPFMRKEIAGMDSPLFMRRTFELDIGRMPLREGRLFLGGMSADDTLDYLSLMSTYPYYLSMIDREKSFEENVESLLFSRGCAFESLPDAVLSDSTSVQNMYGAILNAISHRHATIKEIGEYTHEDPAKVSKYMTTLVDGGVVERRETFMGNRRTHYYAVDDPLLRFWYMFVHDNRSEIVTDGHRVFERERTRIRDFLCGGFEDTAKLYLNELDAKGSLGEIFGPVKNFRAEHTALGRSVEIDGLAQYGKKLLVVECKYRKEPFTNRMMEHLRESASIFSDGWDRVYCVFSKSGFSDDFVRSDDVLTFTAEDMLR